MTAVGGEPLVSALFKFRQPMTIPQVILHSFLKLISRGALAIDCLKIRESFEVHE